MLRLCLSMYVRRARLLLLYMVIVESEKGPRLKSIWRAFLEAKDSELHFDKEHQQEAHQKN